MRLLTLSLTLLVMLLASCHHQRLHVEQLEARQLQTQFARSLLSANIEIWDSMWPCVPNDCILIVPPRAAPNPVVRHARLSIYADKKDTAAITQADSVIYADWMAKDRSPVTHDDRFGWYVLGAWFVFVVSIFLVRWLYRLF